MADFYKGFKKEKVSTQGAVALQAPSTQGAKQDNAVRTQLLTQSIDSLVSVGQAGLSFADKKIKEKRAVQGAVEAGEGKENSAGTFTWGGSVQTEAYNRVRGEASVRDMPSYIDNFMRNDPESSKPFDEMTTEERNIAYARARESFFKEKGLDNAPFREQAGLVANQIQQTHLKHMDKQAAELRQVKSEALLQDAMSTIMGSTGGRAEDVESHLDAGMETFAQLVGGTERAQQLMAEGLLKEVTSDDPLRSTAALDYLKSDKARTRFKSFQDYEQVVQQAETFNQKAKNAMFNEKRAEHESGFYRFLNNGGFANEDQIDGYLSNTILDEKKKFQLKNKAMKHIKTQAEAVDLRQHFFDNRPELVNIANPEARLALFEQQVGSVEFDLNTLGDRDSEGRLVDGGYENALTEWINGGFALPEHIKAYGSSDVFRSQNSNGDLGALDGKLKVMTRLAARTGHAGVKRVFDPDMQAKLRYYGRLKNDARYSKNDSDLIQRLEEFDQLTEKRPNGSTRRQEFQEELREFTDDINSFAAEGGSSIFRGSADLQPLFTFSDMDNEDSMPSFEHARDTVSRSYILHRASGLSKKDAMRESEEDFKANYQWATWDSGSNKNSFVPKELGPNFVNDAYTYLGEKGVYKLLEEQKGITLEEAKNGITIHPSRDFEATRRMQIHFNGVPTHMGFTTEQFIRKDRILKQEEITETIAKDMQLRIDNRQEEEQTRMFKMRKLWDSLDFQALDTEKASKMSPPFEGM